MSDKQHRPVSEIQQEYANVCAKLGQVKYQIHALRKDSDLITKSLENLNLEAAASQRAAEEAKPQAGAQNEQTQS